MGKLHPCDINAENEQDVYFRFFFSEALSIAI